MNFYFGKKSNNEQKDIFMDDNDELDNKLDNIYESIQNIVFNKPENNNKNNKLKLNEKNYNIIDQTNLPNKAQLFQTNNNIFENNENYQKKEINYNKNISNINDIKNKNEKKIININNKNYQHKNNINYDIFEEFNNINNNFKFLNKIKNNHKEINNDISQVNKSILSQNNKINEIIENNNNASIINKSILSQNHKNNKNNEFNNYNNNIISNTNKNIDRNIPINNIPPKENKIKKKESKNNFNKEMINFYNSIKENSPNVFKANSSEKQLSQKEIIRLKLEAFLILKKYYLHRKSKSAWLKRKKKLIKLSENFYRNILLSRAFYGFVLNSKRKSLYNLIKNNYVDFRIKELTSNFLQILKFCYQEKKLENKSFFELTKNKLRRILKEMKSQMIYKRTMDKYLFTQIINNNAAIQFSKIIIYFGNKYNMKKLYRYEYNINSIIYKEEFGLKAKIFQFLKNQGDLVENELNKKIDLFKKNIILLNDKKKFIIHLEEEIILSYKIKYFKEKIFFMRSKYYIISKKNWKKKSAIYGPNRDLILNLHNLKLKKYSFKIIKIIYKKKKQKIEK